MLEKFATGQGFTFGCYQSCQCLCDGHEAEFIEKVRSDTELQQKSEAKAMKRCLFREQIRINYSYVGIVDLLYPYLF